MTELQHGDERRGTVDTFDDDAGLGAIIAEGDGRRYPFHCIEIADGTRTIDAGTDVRFDVIAKFGRWEAANIRA